MTSAAVVALLAADPTFAALSASEGEGIRRRDAEDASKLQEGVAFSISKGVIAADHGASPAIEINVAGRSADEVARIIIDALPPPPSSEKEKKEAEAEEGSVVVLVGLSGTGKGTTVKKLQEALPNVITWSNGNAFRALTHLIAAAAGKDKLTEADVTAERVADAVAKLSFERIEGKNKENGEENDKPSSSSSSFFFDVVIDGTMRVSEVQNTLLKAPVISANVPTVAGQTQGEVILFARRAVETLRRNGHNVILEGRAQTLNYIPTEHRFELVMPDARLLGQRRAAQRVIAHALKQLSGSSTTPEEAEAAVRAAAEQLQQL